MEYTVTVTVQSGDNPPAEVVYARTDSLAQAMSALVQGAATTYDNVPDSLRMRTLSVRLDISED